MPAGRPSKLTPELIEEVARYASRGLPEAMIRQIVNVSDTTWRAWVKEAESPDPPELNTRFLRAIQEGPPKIVDAYLGSLHNQATQGSVPAITWLLTHHPKFRDHFSDAAATRRELQKAMCSVAQIIESSSLSPEQRLELFTRLGAVGLEPPSVDA